MKSLLQGGRRDVTNVLTAGRYPLTETRNHMETDMTRKPLTAAILGALMIAPLAHAAPLTVTVDDIQSQTGTIHVGLYDAAGYEGGEAISGATIEVDAATASATIEGLEPGEYGIKLYHDVDGNGDMNTNPFGMPIEPYAFSNNAKGRFGPASWAEAKFEVTEDGAVQAIKLN